ncbi:MAG: DMT family transporter, partial [Ginsengibacter sp.]
IMIKRSLLVLSPYQIGSIRVAVSGLLLMFIGFPAIRRLPKKYLGWLILAGALGNFFPLFLFPVAQTKVSSALTGILDSVVPVFVLIFGFIFFKINSKLIQLVGALIGFIGAAILMYFSDPSSDASSIGYSLLVILGAACYAAAAVIIKQKLQDVPSMDLSAAVFTIWMFPALIILYFSGFFQDFENNAATWEGLGYVAVLTVVGTALAMILYYRLIQLSSAVFASTVAYLLPLVAVMWGLLDGEHFSIWYAVGGALIFAGIYLIQEKNK